MKPRTQEESIRKLRELTAEVPVAMLSTVARDGSIRSRPMAAQQLDDDGVLWFFTGATSPKAHEIESDQRVNVSYQHEATNTYVSVSGTARLSRDMSKARELWKPGFKAWFPEGLEDPDLMLLRVAVESAEFWDAPNGVVVHAVGFAKALLTGERYEPGDNEKLEIGEPAPPPIAMSP